MPDLCDAELVARSQKGDASAFEAIYDRHSSGVARTLSSFAGPDRDAIDDLTQDVFLRVISGLAAYRPNRPFTHWLYTIVLNIGRNHARMRSRTVAVDPLEFDSIPCAPASIGEWSEDIVADTLTRLVAALPEDMREVVSLRAGSGMAYGEIAQVLGIPEGTARSRMHNAVKLLKQRIDMHDCRRRKHEG
ncbi:MAG: sigma-70 family RNA polymerase sigma factor [Chitinivibrionia bacterium]|nr:sigma-70 family RNA polymerase sigma factor [Chitinivibrionia bacterium]